MMTRTEELLLLETYKIKQRILEHALSASAGGFYNINITKNKVPGTMSQVLNGVEYSINKQIGFSDNCDYTDVISYWGNQLSKEEQSAYFTFFDLKHLEDCFRRGEDHISHQYWTSDVLGHPMLAEQHIIMYEDLLNGDIVGITYVLDLTNLDALKEKETQQRKELEIALKKAEIANDFKTNFLFNISHDIRTPMNAILGFNEIAKKKTKDPEVLEALEKAALSGNQMLKIINDILDMSRIQNGELSFNDAIVNVKKSMSELDIIHRPMAKEKDIHFTFIDETITPYVYGDVARISQVTSNLLSNAIKFTPRGGKVTYYVKEIPVLDVGYVGYEIHVIDNGIGMSEAFQENMYKVFERERSSTLSGVQGTGLGLAITKQIVDHMGGDITCQSEVGEGTEFFVTFKLPIASMEKICEEMEHILKGKRILIVEDIDLNREILMELLLDEQCLVEEAENGEQAVQMVRNSKRGYYDAVLMDIQMPIMDGYMATKAIRALKNKALAKIPIIAVTANAFEADKKEAIRVGMNEHIAKPVDIMVLKRVLRKVLSK